MENRYFSMDNQYFNKKNKPRFNKENQYLDKDYQYCDKEHIYILIRNTDISIRKKTNILTRKSNIFRLTCSRDILISRLSLRIFLTKMQWFFYVNQPEHMYGKQLLLQKLCFVKQNNCFLLKTIDLLNKTTVFNAKALFY